jgi:hypothetical protein
MSTEQKVSLADQAKSEYDLYTVLAAVELPRSTWYYQQKHRRAYTEKYDCLRDPLESIARQNPEYGYHRTTLELRENYGYKINHKVVQEAPSGLGFAASAVYQATKAKRHSAGDHSGRRSDQPESFMCIPICPSKNDAFVQLSYLGVSRFPDIWTSIML